MTQGDFSGRKPHPKATFLAVTKLVILERFELPTLVVETPRSAPLSYRTMAACTRIELVA